jgi:hypothetical protein
MSFVIAGDTHGTMDIHKVVKYFAWRGGQFTKDDYLIICGDTGVCGFSPTAEAKTREILRDLPVTVLFVDGDHEHFGHLNAYPVDEWHGGKVHMIEEDIIHLMRGQVFDIDGTTFFTFGGAYSVDQDIRTEGVSWFPEELPDREEYEEGWRNLDNADFQVDYILSHTGPREVVSAMGFGEHHEEETELKRFLQQVAEHTEFNAWYFGHLHEDMEVEDMFFCLYDTIVEIE